MVKPIIVWLNNDLRLHDNPAFFEASLKGKVIPIYIFDDTEQSFTGSAKKWWLYHSIKSFSHSLKKLGVTLIIRTGEPKTVLDDVIRETNAEALYFNRRYEPLIYERDQLICKSLSIIHPINIQTYEGSLIFPPWEVRRNDKEPYKVFTAFYKAFQKHDIPKPYPSIKQLNPYELPLTTRSVEDLPLLPKINWTSGIKDRWDVSEDAAIKIFKLFTNEHIAFYKGERDFPAKDMTSHLSPYLAAGQISARSIYYSLIKRVHELGESYIEPFARQIIWREFSYHQLFHFPKTVSEPLNDKFNNFDWEYNEELYQKWTRGETGYPLIDAGMKELWVTGFMHNRVRMATASFLVKHLLIPWQKGAEWFNDTLVDADLANNTMGWQWVAGCGADAAPYFRIFNPMLQSEKFDPNAEYIRKWLPQLENVSLKNIHNPFLSPIPNYPTPIVDHKGARERALEKYNEIK